MNFQKAFDKSIERMNDTKDLLNSDPTHPAFPLRIEDGNSIHNFIGVSRLEFFAAFVAQGLCANTNIDETATSNIATRAFNIAKAMCVESDKWRAQ